MDTFFYVGIGGFLGANTRYYLTTFITSRFLNATGWNLPVGTLFVNVTGSFLLAVFSVWLTTRFDIPPQFRLLVGAGFFGAYTTFSTFANEFVSLANNQIILALTYLIVTNLACIIGVLLGLIFAQRIFVNA